MDGNSVKVILHGHESIRWNPYSRSLIGISHGVARRLIKTRSAMLACTAAGCSAPKIPLVVPEVGLEPTRF